MDCLGPFNKSIEEVITFVWKHGVRHLTYIIHYNKNVLELKDSVKGLIFEQERIDHECDQAAKNLQNIEGKVIEWIQKVREIRTTVEDFENNNGHQKARFLNCYVFPYLWNRHRLGRKAKKFELDVKKLIDESPKFDEISYRQDVASNDTTLYNYGYVEFGSTKSIMEKIMTELKDSSVRMIGIYGPGGVGKSTLIKEIGRKAKDSKLFDLVVKVEITANPNLQKIQEEIAYVLGLRLEGEGENVRADCLRRRLKKEKGNTLLIFDDLWEKLDLNKLGIPLDDDDDDDDLSNENKNLNDQKLEKNNDKKDPSRKVLKTEKIRSGHKGCKILLTSRDKKVLCVDMNVKSTFFLKALDEKDALVLFQKLSGIHNKMSDSKQEIVMKYCAGLPMAIVSVARALRNTSESVWEATMEQLKKQYLVGEQTPMDISVKVSYDHLENEEIKSIFLLCAQMGHQPLIMDLLKYSFGLGILEGVSSIWEARDIIKTSIQKLKDSGLLLDESSNNHFNMHDMVRDAALSIAHKHHNVFTLRNGKLDDWPELESCTSISICNSDIIDEFPAFINCPQLKFFQIDTKDPSLKIPEGFFTAMKNMRVLIMTGFHMSKLPYSIQCLFKLRMLCLEQCTLDCNLSMVGQLKKLRILSFSGSQLKSLPAELQCLDKLRLLDISDCSKLNIIPPNLISSLTCLEELYIRKSLIKVLEEEETNKGQDLFLSELRNLHQLKVVDLSISCVSLLPNHLFFDSLKDYKIVIGHFESFSVGEFRMPDKFEAFRVLALQLKDDIDIHSQESIKFLFKTVQSLLLGKIAGVENVVNDLNIEGFPDLKHLSIVNNNEIKYVNSTKLSNYANVFPNLESLRIYNLENLEMICNGPVTVASFDKLKAIKVEMCYQLKNLFSFNMIKYPIGAEISEISECSSYMNKFLTSIEMIEVCECGSLKEILQIPMDYGKVELLKLHTLSLQSLPKFTCFYTEVKKSFWPPLTEAQTTNRDVTESTIQDDHSEQKPLFSGELVCVFPKLEEICLNQMNRLTNIWQTEVSVDSFSSLTLVKIENCNKLENIFPSHMEGWFESLINVEVSKCKSVKEIFEINDLQEIDEFGGIDTNLHVILLENLPKLKKLWSKDPNGILNFHKLRTVEVSHCDELRNLFPASMAKDISNLERMSVLYCEKMVEIVASKGASEVNNDPLVFPELSYVRLYSLSNIKHFYKERHLIKCPNLKEFSVVQCVKLKIFSKEISRTTNKEERCIFSAEEVLSNLEYMEINFNQAQNLLPNYQMHNLKELSLIYVTSVDLFYQFSYIMPNLEKLKLTSYYPDEESESNGDIAHKKRLVIVLQLEELVLLFSTIKDLGLERVPILQRLKLLKLEYCEKLSNLGLPFVSLSYLTYLELKSCQGLRNLMASSTAQSMVQLKTMKVINCNNLKEIVSNEKNEEGKVKKIVFSKLISIELVRLENLASFCSYKDYEFEFPSLEILIIRECMKMVKFSEREPIVPKLKDVFGVEGDEKAKWQWESDLNATIQKVFNEKVSFAYSEDLWLDEFIIEQLWHSSDWVRQKSFGYLKKLSAWGCDSLVHIIPSHLLSCFHNLEELEVGYCDAQVIFNISDENRVTKASGIFHLKKLSVEFLPELEHVWDKDPEGIIGLQFLKEISVSYCCSLRSLFPASVAKDLTRLQVLEVRKCEELEEIFMKNERSEEEEGSTQESVFHRLTTLRLEELPSLKYSIHYSKKQVSTSNLGERDIQELCLGSRHIPNSNFSFLESLTMDGCEFLSYVVLPFSLLPFLTSLETLEVRNCDSVKSIFDVKCTAQSRDVTSIGQTLPFSLKKLTISKLPNLKNVWNEDPQVIVSMNHLQEVCVEKCEGLTSVFPASKDKYLLKLENLVVKECKGLLTIFAEDNINPRTKLELKISCPFVRSLQLRDLPNLKYFYYSSLYCDIFTDLESHTENQVGSGKLFKCLSLGQSGVDMILQGEFKRNVLHNIKALTLCLGSDVFRYKILEQVPNLEKLVVCDSSFKKMFCRESPDNVLQQLKVLQLESLGELVSIGLENSWTDSFVRNLETFEVIRCSSLKNLVACTVSFSNLTYLKVYGCHSLSYLLTSSTAKCLGKLKRMDIEGCNSIEEIVCKEDGEESDEDEIIFPQLTCLNFHRLWKLKRFYRGSLGFPSLEELSITYCDEMITLCVGTIVASELSEARIDSEEVIPLGTELNSVLWEIYLRKMQRESWIDLKSRPELHEIWRGSLPIPNFCFSELDTLTVDDSKYLELEDLVMEECERLVTIVEENNTDPNIQLTLPCPYLGSLKLWRLQKFTYFYYCSHKSDIYTHLESPTEHQLPNEKCLSVGENGMKMILRGEFERKLLDNLKALTLCFGSDVFRCKILEQVPNIEKLVVCDGSFKKMFCRESPDNVLQQLKVLRLEFLLELVSIGLENSWTDYFVRNLEILEVINCPSLKNLVSSTVSFSNLRCLKVENCHSLSYLLTFSTVKRLGQLKRMEMKDCDSIEEIVCEEDGEESDEDEIIFPQLISLNLDSLWKLKRFYRGSLGFPSLEELSLTYCDNMITLCVGSIEADKLSQVKIDEFSDAIQLETELNSIMRKEYLKKNTLWEFQNSLEFRDREDLQEIWRVSLQIPHFCFSYLETLIVNGCQFLSYVLPFTLLPLLPRLETLEVGNCDSVETIFDVKCVHDRATFPLKTLLLLKLPNLETLWNEDTDEIVTQTNPPHPEGTNPKLTFPSLSSLTICDLPNFKHNTIYCIHDAATPTFELIMPNLEHLTVGKDELKKIVDGEFHRNLLDKLKVLGLCFDIECDEFPGYRFLQQLPNVKKLVVCDSSFKVIFCDQRPNNSEFLSQLKELRLESLQELVWIGLENSWTEAFVRKLEIFEVISCSSLENLLTCRVSFSNLTRLKVENCDGLSYLLTSSTAKSLGRLQRMEIEECKSIEEIVSKERKESDEDEIMFPQLSFLNLKYLSNLRWFYRGNLSFPSLQELSVICCDEMVTLCPNTLKAEKLSEVIFEEVIFEEVILPLETDLISTMRKEFGRKISELGELDLKSRPRLQEIWHGSLHIPDLCFSKLATLIVDDCQFLSDTVLPFPLLPLLPKLETLQVRNCDSVKTIFDVQCTTKDKVITLPLEKFTLSNLSNLKNVWNKNPHGILRIHHLRQVHVTKCKDLTSVFPASVAKDLWKLEDLVVEDCEGLMAIVADESDEDEEVIFDRLQVLELKKLQELRLSLCYRLQYCSD
ncbi:Disease resistance protein [Vigna angularis]|uniref:Disease resistance protein n=1 Tax=Phaseolus angularis TaxID=3914 RepID=A0A8T0JUV2_PHAAN|nr:Disease resistance protein [Vigna angularis]